jgi:Protein of unknown function (DUF2585)
MTETNLPANEKLTWPLLTIVAVLTTTAFLLRSEGRLWVCACGQVSFWAGKVCSSNNSQQFLDPYSFTHVLHGVLYFWLMIWLIPKLRFSWRLWLAVTIACVWEIFENTNFVIHRYRADTAALGYNGDTIINSLGDVLCAVIGFMIAYRLGFRRSIILFFAVELVLLVWIRDSLFLEIIMLIHPVPAIKAWQMCA